MAAPGAYEKKFREKWSVGHFCRIAEPAEAIGMVNANDPYGNSTRDSVASKACIATRLNDADKVLIS